MTKRIFLSHILDERTPTYGGRSIFKLTKSSAMAEGHPANNSVIECTVHVGTHIDMPCHFFEDGQKIESFGAEFWFFHKPTFIDVTPSSLLLNAEVKDALDRLNPDADTDILIIRSGIEKMRGDKKFWDENPGLSVEICEHLRSRFPKLRVIGFDSISVSSFQHRLVGREAHKSLLNPNAPILILEDMMLQILGTNPVIKDVVVMPMRIGNSDGMPCTVVATIEGN